MDLTITVVDRRNLLRPEKLVTRVEKLRQMADGIIFQAVFRFPVPACGRRYFMGRREIAVEEIGRVPASNFFCFSGILIARNPRRDLWDYRVQKPRDHRKPTAYTKAGFLTSAVSR